MSKEGKLRESSDRQLKQLNDPVHRPQKPLEYDGNLYVVGVQRAC